MEPLVFKISLLLGHPFLQPEMRFDYELLLRHGSSLIALRLIPSRIAGQMRCLNARILRAEFSTAGGALTAAEGWIVDDLRRSGRRRARRAAGQTAALGRSSAGGRRSPGRSCS